MHIIKKEDTKGGQLLSRFYCNNYPQESNQDCTITKGENSSKKLEEEQENWERVRTAGYEDFSLSKS